TDNSLACMDRQAHLELAALVAAAGVDADEVLAIERGGIREGNAAGRIKRKIVARALFALLSVAAGTAQLGGNEFLLEGAGGRIAHRQPADHARRGHVALDQRRRYRKHV